MGAEVYGDSLGEEFKGYLFKITGGNDKQGFPMMQGVLTGNRVRLLFKDGMPCFRLRRKGQAKRKSVRGCIVGPDLSVLSLVVAKKGANDIPGLTDSDKPRRLGPKRAGNIRKLFNLTKEDDVRKFVIHRKLTDRKTPKTKAPKIQRLVTPERLRRKRRLAAVRVKRYETSNKEREEYKALLDARKPKAVIEKAKPKVRKVAVSEPKAAQPKATAAGQAKAAATTGQPKAAATTVQTKPAAATGQPKAAATTGQPKAAATTGQPKAAATTAQPKAAATTAQPKAAATTGQPKAAAATGQPKPAAATVQTKPAAATGQPKAAAATGQPKAAAATGQPKAAAGGQPKAKSAGKS